MAEQLLVRKKNETFMHITCEDGVAEELAEFFRFHVPGARFSPKYRMKVWDGTITLFSKYTRLLYCGLFSHLEVFCKEREYELKYDLEYENETGNEPMGVETGITLDQVKAFVDALNIHSQGEKLEIRDYQYAAIHTALSHKRRTILCPTASGKSVIIYAVIRYLLANQMPSLVVVPTIALTYQMVNDFKDYSSANGWEVDNWVQMIAEGRGTKVSKKIVVSTWQSIYKLGPIWMNQFGNIMVDEVHQAKSESLKGILEKATKVRYRIGLTGSLDNSKTHKMMIQAILGEIERVAATKDLIDKGFLSDVLITALVLSYGPESRKLVRKVTYDEELNFLVSHEKRNRFIANLALSRKGNTLVLYRFVEKHGDRLYELISEKAKADRRPVYYIHGGVAGDDRDQIRALVEKHNNAVIVASVGTFSVGVNIRRLHNVIFAAPTKSVIRVLQSIGRGLRLGKDKDKLSVYDVADKLTENKKKNHTYAHFIERLGIYVKERFPYRIMEIQLEDDDQSLYK